MRSSTGPILVILNLATIVVLVLVLLQTTGLRGELDAARSDVAALRTEVASMERGVPISELSMRLAELENDIESWVVAFGNDTVPGDTSSPAGGGDPQEEILDRLTELLRRINALDDRVDEICGNVPVC